VRLYIPTEEIFGLNFRTMQNFRVLSSIKMATVAASEVEQCFYHRVLAVNPS
jgi:hypothetical protein